MSKLIGRIGWELQPGYPELSGDDGAEQITEKYIVPLSQIGSIPLPGTLYSCSRYDFFDLFRVLRLRTRNVKPTSSGKAFEVTLVYAYPPGAEPPGDTEVYETVEYDTNEYDAPIEQNKNYTIAWNHRFCVKDSEDIDEWTAFDAWLETYENKDITIPEFYAGLVAWVKVGEKTPDGFYDAIAATKPTVSSFRTGVAVVTQTFRCSSKKKLTKKIKDDFHRAPPPDDFDAVGDWLRGGSKMRKEGRLWVQTVNYTNSRVIDPEIYE